MSYTSFTFVILFFAITYVLHSLIPQKYKWCVLFVSSWAFYVLSTRGHIIPMLATTAIVWASALVIQKFTDEFKEKKKGLEKPERKALKEKYAKKKKVFVTFGVLASIGILLFLKYFNFFTGTVNSIAGTSIAELDLVHPLGLSFYSLQAVSYLVDVYRGKYRAEKNPLKFSLYLSFLLTVTEGPIARYDQLGTQLINSRKVEKKDFDIGVQLLLLGLFKKVVVADRLSGFVDGIFDSYEDYLSSGGMLIAIAVLFYTIQLYCDFSGIMDVIGGMGKLMGIDLPDNFTQPFFANSINNFWQRWHISLGSWLRDYIFYPISLSKPFMKLSKSTKKKLNPYYATMIPTAVALFFVWFSNGLWHGASWKYICYGLYYYVLMMIGMLLEPLFVKLKKALKTDKHEKAYLCFQIIRTDIIVCIGMFIFRAESLTVFAKMLKAVFTSFSISGALNAEKLGLDIKDLLIIFVSVIILFVIGYMRENKKGLGEKIASKPGIVKFILNIVAIMAIIIFGAYGESYGIKDLIYAGF